MAYQQIKQLYTTAHPNHPVVAALFDIGLERGEGVRWVNQERHLFQFIPAGADGRNGYQVLADVTVMEYGRAEQYTADHVKTTMKELRDGDGALAFVPGPDNKYRLCSDHSTEVGEGSGTPTPDDSQEE